MKPWAGGAATSGNQTIWMAFHKNIHESAMGYS